MFLRILALSGLLAAAPAFAQQDYVPPLADDTPQQDGGLSMIERGMGMLLQNLWKDVGPDLNRLGEDMSGSLMRLAPVLEDLSVLVDDLGNYQAPERLANGDIVIRRKPGAPPPPEIGNSLRDLSRPEANRAPSRPAPRLPLDPYAPEIEL